MTRSSLIVLSLSLGCNALSGIEEYEIAPPVSVAAIGPDGAADAEIAADVLDDSIVIDSGVVETIDSGATVAADTAADAGEADVLADALVDADADAGAGEADAAPCTPISHSNGLGQTYLDCAPLGTPGVASTYTVSMASKARAAWPFTGTDSDSSCGGIPGLLYRKTTTSCAVWVYTTGGAGRVHLNTVDNTCYCPISGGVVWQ
jgi:hypothetical protein